MIFLNRYFVFGRTTIRISVRSVAISKSVALLIETSRFPGYSTVIVPKRTIISVVKVTHYLLTPRNCSYRISNKKLYLYVFSDYTKRFLYNRYLFILNFWWYLYEIYNSACRIFFMFILFQKSRCNKLRDPEYSTRLHFGLTLNQSYKIY